MEDDADKLEEMRVYMDEMDQELSHTTLGKSFEKVSNSSLFTLNTFITSIVNLACDKRSG